MLIKHNECNPLVLNKIGIFAIWQKMANVGGLPTSSVSTKMLDSQKYDIDLNFLIK